MADAAATSTSTKVFAGMGGWFGRYADIVFGMGIIGMLVVLLFPVPKMLLDFLLAFSITVSVVILMATLFINRPLDLSVFPTILLVTAVMRLSLNIASTRLILAEGHTGTNAAGKVIEAFGHFVMGGNVVIGAIVFGILTIINFVVITKGSGRIAEVAARFSLDAMPGKQMAIDADLSAGLIDEKTAKTRRKALEDESTFFGAMDGANKFVRGDAIAGLLITFINLIGGIIIGMVQRDLDFSSALQTYTTLTIGDGLVSQIPALIISLAAGLLVSKSGVTGSTERAIFAQLGKHPESLAVSASLLALMAVMPGIPAAPFGLLAMVSGVLAWRLKLNPVSEMEDEQDVKKGAEVKPEEVEESIGESLRIESVKIELGYALLGLINYQTGYRLTDQVKSLRKQIAKDLGFVMPSVRIQDNMQLEANEYVIRIKDMECGKGVVYADKLMVMDPKGGNIDMQGFPAKDPAFGLPAMWIEEAQREQALFKQYTVVDPPTVLTTHLTEIIKENITELLSYSETQKLVDEIGDEHRKLVADVVPAVVSIGTLQRVLQSLLEELVSIRDLPTILETLSEVAKTPQSITQMTEYVRGSLAKQITFSHLSRDGTLPIITMSQHWEQVLQEGMTARGDDKVLAIPPTQLQELVSKINLKMDESAQKGEVPVLLVSAGIRPHLRALIARARSFVSVISQQEVHSKVRIKNLGLVN